MKKILITNDDGYMAKGIGTLAEALSGLGEIYVVAPSQQKSACGHGITLHRPMVVREVEVPFAKRAWSVDGTPADCVKLGIRELVKDVDIVVSGTNMGSNLAEDCFYSGTVAGAAEAVFCGKPAIAVSIAANYPENYEPSMEIARKAVSLVFEKGLEKGTVLNINLPDIPGEEIKGVRITTTGHVSYNEAFKHAESNLGGEFFWYDGTPVKLPQMEGSDILAIREGFISLTPLKFDMTDYDKLDYFKTWFD